MTLQSLLLYNFDNKFTLFIIIIETGLTQKTKSSNLKILYELFDLLF